MFKKQAFQTSTEVPLQCCTIYINSNVYAKISLKKNSIFEHYCASYINCHRETGVEG